MPLAASMPLAPPSLLCDHKWESNFVFIARAPALVPGMSGVDFQNELAQKSSDEKMEWLLQNALYANARIYDLEKRVATLEVENAALREAHRDSPITRPEWTDEIVSQDVPQDTA